MHAAERVGSSNDRVPSPLNSRSNSSSFKKSRSRKMLSSYAAIEVSPSDEHWIDAFWHLRNFATPLDGWFAYSLFDFRGKSFLQVYADGFSSAKDLSRTIRNFGYWTDRRVIDWYMSIGYKREDEKELLKIFSNAVFTLKRPHDKFEDHYKIYRGIGREDALNLFSCQEVESFKLEGRKVDYYDRNKLLFQMLVDEKYDPREEFPKGISRKLEGPLKNLAKKFLELDYTADVVVDVFGLQNSKKSQKKLWFVRTRFFGAYLLEEGESVEVIGYDFGGDERISTPLSEELIKEFECTRWGLELKWGDKTPIEVEDIFRRFENIRDTLYALRSKNYEETEEKKVVQEKLYVGSSSRREFRECNITRDTLSDLFRSMVSQVEDVDFYVLSISSTFKENRSHTHILSFKQGFSCIWARYFEILDGHLVFKGAESEISLSKENYVEHDLRNFFEQIIPKNSL
jgi:hypothetical protein